MTSPSETPLDLDVLRATLTKARGYAAKVKKPATRGRRTGGLR